MKRILRRRAAAVVAVLVLSCSGGSGADKIPLRALDPATVDELKGYLDAHRLAPEDYIAGKFDDHDVVFVGEAHSIKHDGELIQRVIPKLHARGVYVLATEFARREDQPLIDSLMSLTGYDPQITHEVMFRQFLHHPFEEYAGVFRAAWELNHSLPSGAPRFRIVALNDSPDWSQVKTAADRDNDEVKRRVWHGQGEHLWADAILAEVERGAKVLVYCGMHHAFTEYQMPVVNPQTGEVIRLYPERAGNYVYAKIGKRAITISLHHPWFDGRFNEAVLYPVDGVIDALMKELGPAYYPVGFDTRGTPFGALAAGEGSLYAQGHDGLTLEGWCDGYVFTKPVSQYEGMTPIPDFVNLENLERARATSWDPRFRRASAEDFQSAAMKTANVRWKYRKFE